MHFQANKSRNLCPVLNDISTIFIRWQIFVCSPAKSKKSDMSSKSTANRPNSL